MKILAFASQNSSTAYYRIILPLDLMDADIQIRNNLHTSHVENINLFVYNHIIPEEAARELQHIKKVYGFKVGIDVDDYWILDKSHPYKRDYDTHFSARLQIAQLSNADFVTVTNERLAAAVKQYNRNVHILPNAIPQARQFIEVKPVPHPDGLIRVFWQGSSSHLGDIASIQEALKALKHTACGNYLEMVLAGYVESAPIWNSIASHYTDKGQLRHSLLSPLHYENYYHLYAEADMCIVPLRKTLFNGMKSNLKILEAGNLKLPVIASKVNPYLDMPVRYANSGLEWVKHISELAVSANRRQQEGERLHEYCKAHFNFDKINKERKQIYQHYSN